jgi:2-C-methyl-D-erythritol 4-phosphate cytidylyltransferase
VTLASKILDTVKRVSDDVVKETLNRNELVTVQTPQGFISRVLREAFKSKKENPENCACWDCACFGDF